MQTIDAYMQEIAKKHGLILQKDDPVMVMHTFMELFLHDLNQAQIEASQLFVSTLEMEHTKWDIETKARAERILSAAIITGTKIMDQKMENGATKIMNEINSAVNPILQELEQKQVKLYHISIANMISACLLAMAGLFVFLR